MKIRNAHQYREALDQLRAFTPSTIANVPAREFNRLLALAEAVEAYELKHAEPRNA